MSCDHCSSATNGAMKSGEDEPSIVEAASLLFDAFGFEEDEAVAEKESFLKKEESKDEGSPFDETSNLRLVDRALEDIGTGSYQRRVFALALCSFFLDASEMSLGSLLIVEFMKMWHSSTEELALISSFSSIGSMMGSLVFGWVSDRYGRMIVLKISLIICVIAGLISSFSNSVLFFACARLFAGFGLGGNIVSANAFLSESVPSSKRGQYVILTSVAFGIAHFINIGLAWVLFPTIGWRWVIRLSACLVVPVMALLPFVRESPRYYVMRGDYNNAVEVVSYIAKADGQDCPSYFTVQKLGSQHVSKRQEEFEGSSSDSSSLSFIFAPCQRIYESQLFTGRNLRVLSPLCALWFLQAFASGIFEFLPLELKQYIGGKSIHFVTALVMSVASIVGTLVNVQFVKRLPRVTVLRVATLGSGLATLSLILGKHAVLLFISVFIMHLFSCITLSSCFLYTPEVFATRIRVTAMGLCLVFYRVAKVFAPFLVAAIAKGGIFWSSIVFSVFYAFAAISTWFLTPVPLDCALYEEDYNKPKKKKKSPGLDI